MSDPHAQPAQSDAALAGLYHMSTTAGAGTQDYVAINPTAIVALLLGLSSILAMLTNLLLVIPLAGLICGIIAVVQVRRSNQTQTGFGLATLGILLSLLLGGGRAAYAVISRYHTTADEREIADLLERTGQEIAQEHYAEAYANFDTRFRERISRSAFETAFRGFRNVPTDGAVESIRWNNVKMLFEADPDSGVVVASAMALFKFSNDPVPRRSLLTFEKIDGVWRIDNIEAMFPKEPGTQSY